MKFNLTKLFCLLLLGVLLSCGADDDFIDEVVETSNTPVLVDYNTYKPISSCGNYQFHKPQGLQHIDFATEYNGDIIYGSYYGLQIWDEFGSGLLHEIDDSGLGVRSVTKYEDYGLICTNKGIYKYDNQKNLIQLTEVSCSDLVVYEDKVLFSSPLGLFPPEDRRGVNIHQLNVEQGTYDFFTDPSDDNNNTSISELHIVGDKIFANSSVNFDIRISEFEGSKFIRDYTPAQNTGLEKISWPGDPQLIADGEDLYLWTSNGSSKYLFLKQADQFIEVINTDNYTFPTGEFTNNEFVRANLRDFKIENRKLLVGSGRGIFDVDLASPSIGKKILVDSLLSSRSISFFNISDELGKPSYVVTNYDTVVKISCD